MTRYTVIVCETHNAIVEVEAEDEEGARSYVMDFHLSDIDFDSDESYEVISIEEAK